MQLSSEQHQLFDAVCDGNETFVLTTHMNPDGDALGSEIALARYLVSQGKTVRLINGDPTAETLAFITLESPPIEVYDPEQHDDVIRGVDRIVLVDNSAPDRLGRMEPIMLSGNTDCYQPVERKLNITREVLKVCARYRHPVGIITKNAMILRDLDILADLAKAKDFHDFAVAIDDVLLTKDLLIDGITVRKVLLELSEIHHGNGRLEVLVVESPLGKTTVKGHLATFETRTNGTTGAGLLSFVASTRRLAEAGAFATAESFDTVLCARSWF